MNAVKTSAAKNGILKGAMIISLGGLIAKILGAVYRVPLTNILKSEGLGVYQTAFPVYSILLTFSSSGVPSALAKLISSGEDKDKLLSRAVRLFIPLGILGSLLMAALAAPLSQSQGNPQAKYAYIALSPSVLLVSAISCARGYFQGLNDMYPTAASQVVEQTVKLAFGLFLCYLFRNDYALAGAAACFAVTLSELAALAFLLLKLKKRAEKPKEYKSVSVRRILATVIPVTISAILLPLARMYDSFTIINLIGVYSDDAKALYGIYTGSVESVVGVPVALCYGAAVSSLPVVSAAIAAGDTKKAKNKTLEALSLTLFLSAILSTALSVFAPFVVNLLFKGLSVSERELTAELLRFSGINVVLLATVQTCAALLVAYGKPYVSCAFLFAGLIVKAVTEIFFLKNPAINIFGALYSDILCYLIAIFGDLVYIIIYNFKLRNKDNEHNACVYGRGGRRFNSRDPQRAEKR